MRLSLREVTAKDMDLLYEWANDPTVRQNAFHTEPIPYEDHKMWFAKNLADREVLMYILCSISAGEKEEPLGQIRLSIEEDKALIDYSVDASRRGQGLGAKMILMAEEKLRESRRDVTHCIARSNMRIRHLQRYLKNAGMTGRIWNSILSFLSV